MHRVVVIQAGDTPGDHSEGRPVTWAEGRPVNVSSLAATLGYEPDGPENGPIVILTGTTHRHAFRVDALLGQREVDAGADGYILKSSFDERALLAAVERLPGTPA